MLVNEPYTYVLITTVASTQSPVKQLLTDALVCAKEKCAKDSQIFQCDIQPDILLSLSFQCKGDLLNFLIYNYKCHEIPETKCWCLGM